jgi:hypothetical protein
VALLNQIIAVETGMKQRVFSTVTQLHGLTKKADLFNGFHKSYQPNDEEGDKLPPEKKLVQYIVEDILEEGAESLGTLMDITARKDWTNCKAKADVVVGETVILKDAPVTYLLFMEKQLTDFHKFVATLPVLDDTDRWEYNDSSGFYQTDPIKTHRTKRRKKSLTLAQATEKFPAQAVMIEEDDVVGYWTNVRQSGAMRKPDKDAILERIDTLLIAVKEAREKANTIEEEVIVLPSEAIFGYLLQ